MSIFTLDWFKSKTKKTLDTLKLEEQLLKNNLLKKELEISDKPYKKLKLVNDVLTVVLKNGEVLSKPSCTIDDFDTVKNSQNEIEIITLFNKKLSTDEIVKEVKQQKILANISSKLEMLSRMKDFDVEHGSVKLKGINRTIPQLLVEKFIDVISLYQDGESDPHPDVYKDEQYLSLKRFFMWCCLNPRAEVADELYRFLVENSFRITKQGFFVALRNVVSLEKDHGSNEKVQFISNAYNKIKAVWKKNPANFNVYNDNGYVLVDSQKQSHGYNNFIGNLKELYLDLPNMTENRFTDDWTKTFDIRIGRIVSMPMEQCNWSTRDCAAAGLHFTSDQIHYVGCGDTSVLMLINPMKVVGIGTHKGRCYEYLPIMTVPREEATQILHDLDFDTIDLDEFYVENELESLSEKAQAAFVKETKKYQFNLPSISSSEIGNIVKSLNKMRDELSNRVKEVV
jgi:hypothetical protein